MRTAQTIRLLTDASIKFRAMGIGPVDAAPPFPPSLKTPTPTSEGKKNKTKFLPKKLPSFFSRPPTCAAHNTDQQEAAREIGKITRTGRAPPATERKNQTKPERDSLTSKKTRFVFFLFSVANCRYQLAGQRTRKSRS
uniref:Uncharacterized protein n=1 Tax=Oryza nivara TaxID=4536 RepID=A0A0E0H093_ORYNI